MIERKEYLEQLEFWKNKDIIKVITGIRRCGKSTLLKLYQERLISQEIMSDQIISINFEDMDFENLLDYRELYKYIKDRMIPDKDMYIFLDEIQKVDKYENVVDSLFIKDNIDIYITGSSSYLFSGQLTTNLRGRYIEISMLPLSFKEYYSLFNGNKNIAFQEYMKTGGFPYIHHLLNATDQIDMYIEGIYNTVLLKDIEERLTRKEKLTTNSRVSDVALLKSISKYLASVAGSPVSIRSIANYLISNERKVSPNTVSDYINALCESYLYYPVELMDISGKELLKSNKKYYIVDLGIRNYVLPKKRYDLGFSIENIVYFELMRRGYDVYIGKGLKHTEVDFIAKKNNEYTYFQVTASMVEESTFQREMKPLENIKDNYDKIILTLDEYTIGNYNGIKVINVIDWLLN